MNLIKLDTKRLLFIDVHKKGSLLLVEIKDNAGGIEEALIDKVFDPYFTTKVEEEGTGIGLYMSKDIMTKLLGGMITVENTSYEYEGETYKGAKFTLVLDAK